MEQNDVLSYQRKDGTIIMKEDAKGKIDILDEDFKKQVEDKLKEAEKEDKK